MKHRATAAVDLHLIHPLALARDRRLGRRRVFADDYLAEFREAGVVASVQRAGGDYPLLDYDLRSSEASIWLPRLLATLEQLEAVHAEVDEGSGLRLILEPDDWAGGQDTHQVGVVLALEGVAPIARELWLLDILVRLGVRSVQLTWNDRNDAAAGIDVERDCGLSEFGRACVKRLNQLGVVIDVAHLAAEGIQEVLARSSAPVMCSHANARALCDHPRNLRDEQIRAIAERGGLCGVTVYGDFIAKEGATLDHLLDHVEHVIDIAGPEHVGIGSDLMYYIADIIELVLAEKPLYQTDQQMLAAEGFETLAGFPALWAGLRERGHSEDVIAGIAGGNFRRLFAEVRTARAEVAPR